MLEICCGSYYDALQAEAGGAKRIELNSALALGGLTPSAAVLELVKENTSLSVIAMVRPRGGGFCYSKEDYLTMKKECEALLKSGADGIAFGCLNSEGDIDEAQSGELVSMIHSYGKEAVFHRAFDVCRNPYDAMEILLKLKADRLLTSGQKPKAEEGLSLIKELAGRYGTKIELLAGSGVNASNARRIMDEAGISQVHSSCKDWKADPTTHMGAVSFGFAPKPLEDCYDVVSEHLVRQLLESMGE